MATPPPSRAGGPQPLFSPNSSTRTHPISFSTSDAMRLCLETVRTAHRPRETPSGATRLAPSRRCGDVARSAVAVFARSEPRRQPFVRGNPSRPAGACGALPAGSATDVRAIHARTAGRATSFWVRRRDHRPGERDIVRRPLILVSFSILIPNALSSLLFFCARRLSPGGKPRRDRVGSFAGRRRDHSPGGRGTSSLMSLSFSILISDAP